MTILSQGEIGKHLSIAYASRTLVDAKINYTTIEEELLAMVHAAQQFRPYSYGRKFTLVTDHRALAWLHHLKDAVSWLARWRFEFREYDFEVIDRLGRVNVNADGLSRNPISMFMIGNDDIKIQSNGELINDDGKIYENFIERMFVISETGNNDNGPDWDLSASSRALVPEADGRRPIEPDPSEHMPQWLNDGLTEKYGILSELPLIEISVLHVLVTRDDPAGVQMKNPCLKAPVDVRSRWKTLGWKHR